MATQRVRLVNFGRSRAGLSTVGYAIFDATGSIVSNRTQVGVYELSGSTGIYGAFPTFSDGFVGSVVWDTGQSGANLLIAAETYDFRADGAEGSSTAVNVRTVMSASILASGSVLSGSTTSLILTTLTGADDFYTGYAVRVIDNISGSALRFIDRHLSTSGSLALDSVIPFSPTSGSVVLVLSQLDESFGSVG